MMIKVAVKTSLYENVIRQIADLIKKGDWLPGERILSENSLAKEFGVSRNCMREALKALANAGILSSTPGRGTFLSPQALRNVDAMELMWQTDNDASFAELMEARMILEPTLAYMAAQKATEQDVNTLRELVEEATTAYHNSKYSLEIGFAFHRAVAAVIKNRVLNKLLLSIENELKAERRTLLQVEYSEDLLRELREHDEIFQHIRDRNPEQARDIMLQHLDTAKRILNSNGLQK
jgi:GntR family transcriptional regulator, transcriptional repressor for pyruvate dehydrogenase complex